MKQERGRCLGRDLLLVAHQINQVLRRILAQQVSPRSAMGDGRIHRDHRVTEDREIRTTARLIDRVDRVLRSGVEMRGRRRSEMPPCAKPHHAQSVRLDRELTRAGPQQSDRPLHIEHRGRVLVLGGQPVFQHERGDTLPREELRDLLALMINRQAAIAAPRTDNDPRPRVLPRLGQPDCQRRLVRLFGPHRARSPFRPQRQHGRFRSVQGQPHQ